MESIKNKKFETTIQPIISDGNGGYTSYPEIMTEAELIRFLRIPEISKSSNYHNVVANLKRMQGIPRLHLCGRTLYPTREVLKWISEKTTTGK